MDRVYGATETVNAAYPRTRAAIQVNRPPPPPNRGSAHEPFVGCEIVTVSAVTACASPVPAAVTHSPTATSPTVALTVSVMTVELEMLTVTFFVFSFGVAFELDGRENVAALTTT